MAGSKPGLIGNKNAAGPHRRGNYSGITRVAKQGTVEGMAGRATLGGITATAFGDSKKAAAVSGALGGHSISHAAGYAGVQAHNGKKANTKAYVAGSTVRGAVRGAASMGGRGGAGAVLGGAALGAAAYGGQAAAGAALGKAANKKLSKK